MTQLQGTKGSELMAPTLVRTIGQKDGDMGALFLSHQVPQMLLRHLFLLPSYPLGKGQWMVGIALSSCLALLDTVAKSPAASWRMAKACSAPRRGQLLMRSLMQLHQGGRGPGELGLAARLRLQLVSLWRL